MVMAIPESSQRPAASFPALAWLLTWILPGFGMAFAGNLPVFAALIVIGVAGWLPTREGPLFQYVLRKLRFRWKLLRMGTAYRREISSTQMVPRAGVSPLKGLFKVEIALLEFRGANDKFVQIPALLNGKRHSIMIEAGPHPRAALADDNTREILNDQEANYYVDLAEELGVGNSLTVWSLHRRLDASADSVYLEDRLDEGTDHGQLYDSIDEVTEGTFTRRHGITLTAETPSSWKPRRLNRLTWEQLQASAAVKAALLAEDKMEAIGLSNPRVSNYPSFRRILRELFSTQALEQTRQRLTQDGIKASLTEQDGKPVDTSSMFSAEETPLPVMQRELANTYMIFDGTYHRVLWVTHYMRGDTPPGRYDALHTAPCEYFVSTYCDIVQSSKDDSRRQDKARLLRQVQEMFKRNITAEDQQALAQLDTERFDALQYGNYVIYFRTIIIVSGDSLEDLEENQRTLTAHLGRANVRIRTHAVTGADQLPWFFAALGSYGVGK